MPDTSLLFDVMTTLSKTLLAVSATGFAAGSIIDSGRFTFNPSWGGLLPVGAVYFGLFLISFMLEKEVAKFDEEESMKLLLTRCNPAAPMLKQKRIAQPTVVQLKGRTL